MKTELLYFCLISLKRTVYWLFFSIGYETGMGVVPISQTTVGIVISSINNTSRETTTCLDKSFSFLLCPGGGGGWTSSYLFAISLTWFQENYYYCSKSELLKTAKRDIL
jgi:hypothetical protein